VTSSLRSQPGVQSGCYVFGIVPAGSPLPETRDGGPAAQLQLVAVGDIAALVGAVPTDRPLGRAADLRAHERVLADVVASGTPVLPMRFGAVLEDETAVAEELLGPNREEFADALASVTGRVQYSVKVRYDQDVVLPEVVAAHPEIARLRKRPDDRAAQLRLGQLVVRALERLRPADASAVLTDLVGTVDVRVREPGSPDDVLDAAFLVDKDRAKEFEQRVEQVAARGGGRVRIRLMGPTAPYDFVGGD
jgi:Gas vesicle synthesis protein GvpL/GvpF